MSCPCMHVQSCMHACNACPRHAHAWVAQENNWVAPERIVGRLRKTIIGWHCLFRLLAWKNHWVAPEKIIGGLMSSERSTLLLHPFKYTSTKCQCMHGSCMHVCMVHACFLHACMHGSSMHARMYASMQVQACTCKCMSHDMLCWYMQCHVPCHEQGHHMMFACPLQVQQQQEQSFLCARPIGTKVM